MLVDPLPVKILNLANANAVTVIATPSFALIDAGSGSSVRTATIAANGINGLATLRISHAVTKENGVIPTDRTLIRMDLTGLKPSSTEAGTLKAYAYLVAGMPRGILDSGNQAFDPRQLVELLLGVIAVNPTSAVLSDANLLRILAGEP